MRVLIFEYITGGGLNKQELPASLLREGLLMLRALLEGFRQLDNVDVAVLLDERLMAAVDVGVYQVVTVSAKDNYEKKLIQAMKDCDAVWVVAPETNDVLYNLCNTVEIEGKQLLNPAAKAVAVTANKYATYLHLRNFSKVDLVPTWWLAQVWATGRELFVEHGKQWIVKVVDGVGCENLHIIDNLEQIRKLKKKNRYIIQPHFMGKKTSLSCLFKQGRAWLVCVNEQHFELVDRQYRLRTITVNIDSPFTHYEAMLSSVAEALPGLWGYVGIDLIENEENIMLLEINPRLTTSFVGIQEALGINIAEQVLHLVYGDPDLTVQHNRMVEVIVNG